MIATSYHNSDDSDDNDINAKNINKDPNSKGGEFEIKTQSN